MSLKLMVRVMEEIEVTRPQQLVLLSMAENARDDGSHCFPSIDLIAWKAGYRRSAVKNIMRDLRHLGVLEVVAPAVDHRPTEYHIHLDRAPQKPSFEAWVEANGRHRERGPYKRNETPEIDPRECRESDPREPDRGSVSEQPGVNLGTTGGQSGGFESREIDPRTVSRTVKEPSENRGGGARAPRPPRKTTLPETFGISDRLLRWAEAKGFTAAQMESQLERFRNHALAKNLSYADWDAAFQNWMHNARDWGHLDGSRGRASPPRQSPNVHTHAHDESVDWFGEYAPTAKGSNR